MADPLQITTPGERAIQMRRVFDAPRRLVFDCWTKPELLKRWMTGPEGWTFVVCEIDLRLGGAFRFVWRGPDGTDMGMRGIYREVVPAERIVNTEKYDEDWTGGETLVTGLFAEHAGRTTVTTTIVYASTAARDAALASGMEHGVAAGYGRLDEYLASLA